MVVMGRIVMVMVVVHMLRVSKRGHPALALAITIAWLPIHRCTVGLKTRI